MHIINTDKCAVKIDFTYPFENYAEYVKDSGCYYIAPEICKNIMISAGAGGLPVAKAIQKVRRYIEQKETIIKKLIPAVHLLNKQVIYSYAGELAEGIIEATHINQGVEVLFGYPRILVIKVN